MKGKTDPRLLSLREQRAAVVALRGCYETLREAIRRHCDEEQISLTAFVSGLRDVLSARVHSFMEGKRALSRGRILDRITDALELDELRREVHVHLGKLPSERMQAIAMVPAEALEVGYALHEAYLTDGAGTTMQRFANAFQPHEFVVQRVFWFALDGWLALAEPTVLQDLRRMLEEQVWLREHAPTDAERTYRTRAEHFRTLYAELLRQHGQKGKVARAMDRHPNVLDNVLTGVAGVKTVEACIAKAEALLGHAPPAAGASPTLAQEAPAGGPGGTPWGVTSISGAQFVVTPESFRPLEGYLGEEAIAFAKRAIEAVRATLNLCAQLKDDVIRERVRAALSREVEELELAIRHFSAEVPNRLTKLYQDQRKAWYATAGIVPPKRNGKEKQK